MHIIIKKGDTKMVAQLSLLLPEFQDPYNAEEISERIIDVPHLIHIAYIEEKPVGFKVAYQREDFFYSWLGGVLPKYRRYGVAKKLANEQEKWAIQNGYDSITFKTRNKHKAMLCFSIKNGFDIIGFEEKDEIGEHRIWLKKTLT